MGWVEVPEQITGTTGRSAKNNNPFNLEYRPGSYQDKYGATLEPTGGGHDKGPRFGKYPTMEAGYLAGIEQIKMDAKKGKTLGQFTRKFSPDFENPTPQLIAQYSNAVGASPDTPLSQIDPQNLAQPMLARESSTRTSYRIAGQGKGKQTQTQPQGGKWVEVPEEEPGIWGSAKEAFKQSVGEMAGTYGSLIGQREGESRQEAYKRISGAASTGLGATGQKPPDTWRGTVGSTLGSLPAPLAELILMNKLLPGGGGMAGSMARGAATFGAQQGMRPEGSATRGAIEGGLFGLIPPGAGRLAKGAMGGAIGLGSTYTQPGEKSGKDYAVGGLVPGLLAMLGGKAPEAAREPDAVIPPGALPPGSKPFQALPGAPPQLGLPAPEGFGPEGGFQYRNMRPGETSTKAVTGPQPLLALPPAQGFTMREPTPETRLRKDTSWKDRYQAVEEKPDQGLRVPPEPRGMQAQPPETPPAAEPDVIYHGTTKEVASKIRESGQLSLEGAKRLYDYSEWGINALYAARPNTFWFSDPEGGRALKYEDRVPLTINPKARIRVLNSQEDVAKLANEAGFKDARDMFDKLWIDNMQYPEQMDKNKIAESKASHEKLSKIADIIDDRTDNDQIVILNKDMVKPPQPPAPKEPWEMTRERWISSTGDHTIQGGKFHRNEVTQALSQGKPVPPEVLKDYPDLNPKTPAKEPWEMTRAEFRKYPPKGYQIKKLPDEDIARAENDGTISLDPDKYFGQGDWARKAVIEHERAHFLEEKIDPEYKAKLFDNPTVMNYRGRNINEKLANMIQDGKLPSEVLKDYPDIQPKVKEPWAETLLDADVEGQRLVGSIKEGEMILKSKVDALGRKRSKESYGPIQRAVDNSKDKLGRILETYPELKDKYERVLQPDLAPPAKGGRG